MSGGYVIAFFETVRRSGVEAVLSHLERNGFPLTNPLTNRITRLSPEGDQIETPREDLVQLVASQPPGSELSFQLWVTESVDVVCRTGRVRSGGTRFRYSLDGLATDESERLIGAITQHVTASPPELCALVVDRRGLGEEIDWDEEVSHRRHSGDAVHCDVLFVDWWGRAE